MAGKRLKRQFQFGIRTILLLTVAVALFAAWVGGKVRQHESREEVYERFVHCHPEIVWENKQPVEIYFHNLAGAQTFGNEEMEALTDYPSLRILSIWEATELTDDGFKHIAALENLLALRVNEVPIGDAALAHIRQLTELRTLILRHTNVTDDGMRHMSALEHLLVVDLTGCTGVTDEGIRHLVGLRQLDRLHLKGTGCTRQGARFLEEALPQVDVCW